MDISILMQSGIILGGIVVGAVGAIKLPITKTNGKSIATSKTTGGALHISEEGLGKYKCIEKRLEKDFLTEDSHDEKCGKQQSDMKLYVNVTLAEKLDATADKIIKAIKP